MQNHTKKNVVRLPIKHNTNCQYTKVVQSQKIYSQKTLDSLDNEHQHEILHSKNEQQLQKQIKQTIQLMTKNEKHIISKTNNQKKIDIEYIKSQQLIIQSKDKQLEQLHRQIQNLKQIPIKSIDKIKSKSKINNNRYFQDHIKVFTLADQIIKQRKHLQLHLQHHQKIRSQAQAMHLTIKESLPKYYYFEKNRSMKPISYGQFKAKALILKKQKERKERQKNIKLRSTSRSISNNSSTKSSYSKASVKDIINGNIILSKQKSQKSLGQLQRKKNIIEKAKETKLKRHDNQIKSLMQTIFFLRDEDEAADNKINELLNELVKLQVKIQNQFSQLMTFSNNVNKT